MALFTGLIKCQQCGKNFNFKNNNQTFEYVCQTRKNYGLKKCNMRVVREDYILNIIKKHADVYNQSLDIENIGNYVCEVKISQDTIVIAYVDKTTSYYSPNEIVF